MKLGLLKKGDAVLNVTERAIVIKRKNGETDLISLIWNENGIPEIDFDNIITVSYGDNTIEYDIKAQDGSIISITDF